VHRVGNPVPIPTNVRVLAATNREPRAAIEEGKLREDLYFRLSVFPVNLPPLRERAGDIELLAQHFLDLLNEAHGTARRWADGALAELARREWRGNVRELKNAVQRAFILADDVLTAEDVALQTKTITPEAGGALSIQVGCSIASSERQLICATLEHVKGDKRAAAAILGISLKTLYNRLNVYEASNT
jgi:DNA-binding NtrC family response regulator